MPDVPVAAAPVKEMKPSPALQIIGKMKDTIMGPRDWHPDRGMVQMVLLSRRLERRL